MLRTPFACAAEKGYVKTNKVLWNFDSQIDLLDKLKVQHTVTLCKTAPLKKTKNVFQNQLSLNAGQKYCRMLQREHSAILSTFIKLPVGIKT